MAKDQQGHGSNRRGTRASTPKYEAVHINSGTVLLTGVSKAEARKHLSSYPDKHRFTVRPVKGRR